MINSALTKDGLFHPIGPEINSLFFNNKLNAPSYVQVFDDKTIVEIELPRFKRDEISIIFKDGYLNVDAVCKEDPRRKIVAEKIGIDNNIDENKISARLSDGVLYITLPKAEQLKGKQILIME